jgi:phage recombination protein Bet
MWRKKYMADLEKYTYETEKGEVNLTPDSVRKYLVNGNGVPDDTELMMFLSMCKYNRINPFIGEAWLIKYKQDSPAQIVIARNLMQSRAAAFEKYDGMRSGIIVVRDEKIVEGDGSFHLPSDELVGAWAEGYRKDWKQPRKITVSFEEYKPTYARSLWDSKPGTMIVKVAEAQLLRAIIPGNFEGAYTPEELSRTEDELQEQASDMRDVTEAPEDVEEIRKEIYQLLEDNADMFEDSEVIDWKVSFEDATVIADLEILRSNLEKEIKNYRGRENRAISKDEQTEFFVDRKESDLERATDGPPKTKREKAEAMTEEQQEIF